MAEENHDEATSSPNIHLQEIQKTLTECPKSERIKLLKQLEVTLHKYKTEMETNPPGAENSSQCNPIGLSLESPTHMSVSAESDSSTEKELSSEDSDSSLSSPDLLQNESVQKNPVTDILNITDSSNLEGEKVEDRKQPIKHCTNCGKLKKKHPGDVIQLDTDSENSYERDVLCSLCCSETSEDEDDQDQLNIEYVPASQEDPSSGDLMLNSSLVREPSKLRGLEINLTKLDVLKKPNLPSPSPKYSPIDTPKEDGVLVEFDIGAEISVGITAPSINTPTKYSPLLKKAPTKRSLGGKRRKDECTACHVTTIKSSMKFLSHPWLGVLICQKCLDFINSGEYSLDEGKEIYCRWCGDGGEIANCGSCEKSFCKLCLDANLGDDTWGRIQKDDGWNCFICDDAPIRHLVEECIQMLQEKEDFEEINKSKKKVIQARKSGNKKKGGRRRESSSSSAYETESADSEIPVSSKPIKKRETEDTASSPSSAHDKDKSDDVTSENPSENEFNSLSASDLELLNPKTSKRKRKRIQTESAQDESSKEIFSSDKADESVEEVKVKRKTRSTPKKKKLKIQPFGSSEDEGSANDANLISAGERSSREDSDVLEEDRKLEVYEYQVGSEEEQSSSDICDTELKVKKRKRAARQKKRDLDSENEAELSLMKKSKSRKRGRRKAKLISDSSPTASDSDASEGEKGRKKGRKKIRKLIKDFNLSQTTREAEKEEQERMKRLKRKHSASVDLTDMLDLTENADETLIGVEPLVLEEGSGDKEPFCINPEFVEQLKPHQRDGVVFLWESVCESLKMLNEEGGSGSLLAHCMGLGKTLQVITLLDTLLCNSDRTGITKVLVMTPVNVLYNWKAEFDKWVDDRSYYLHILETKEAPKQRIKKLEFWDSEGGVLLIGYEMFRNFSVGKKLTQRKKDRINAMLVDPGAQIVVCDEGHVMRNSKSSLSKCLNLIGTRRRIVLTGTPLQNNLQEYYCMTNFIKPNLLGSQTEFTNRFANPITNGQHADSTPLDVRIMKQRAHVLHSKLKGCVQRQDYTALTKYLPPKHEFVVSIRLTELQINLYEHFFNSLEKRELFPIYNVARRIWSHPWILKREQEDKRAQQEKKMDGLDSMGDFIVTNSSEEDASGSEPVVKKKKLEVVTMRRPAGKRSSRKVAVERNREMRDELKRIDDIIDVDSSSSKEDDDYIPEDLIVESKPNFKKESLFGDEGKMSSYESEIEPEEEWPRDWFDDDITPDVETQMEHSAKLLFLFELLDEAKKLGEKVLVFSQSLQMLDLIEYYLQRSEHDFVKGLHYYRMDGSTPIDTRDVSSSIFNNPKHPRMRLFLISTKAGSLGINLIAANRVVIMDASWNPTHDTQSIFRVYRFGQVKPVFIYRLIAKGTMEEKIYDRQVTKESLSLRVIDEQQIGRHFTSSDLAELFRFNPDEIRYKEPDFIRIVDSEDSMQTMDDIKPALSNHDDIKSIVIDDNDTKPMIKDDKLTIPKVSGKTKVVHDNNDNIVEVSDENDVKSNLNNGEGEKQRPVADLVLCNILNRLQPKFIIDYHEHDSLTEHIFDEELSEEEKKAAWDNFNASKEAISREYVQQMWKERQMQQTQHQQAQFDIARQMMEQGIAPMQQVPGRPPVPPIHQMLASSSNQSPVVNKMQHQILKQAVAQYQDMVAKNPSLGNAEHNNLFAAIHFKITEEYNRRLAQQNQPVGIPPPTSTVLPVPMSMVRGNYPMHVSNTTTAIPANLQRQQQQQQQQVTAAPVSILQPIDRRMPPPNMQPNTTAVNSNIQGIPLQQQVPISTHRQIMAMDNPSGLLSRTGAVGEKSYPSFAEQTYSVEDSVNPSQIATSNIETVTITESPTK